MPPIQDWLRSSWNDFLRRWPTLMAVAGISGGAALVGAFLPFLVASLATALGADPGTAFGMGGAVALSVGLWLAMWSQAAVLRAAISEESAAEALSRSWGMAPAFAWVTSLFFLAVGGGFFLLLLPSVLLGVLFFFAPTYQMSGEVAGMRAMELSWARVRPRMGAASLRIFLASLLAVLPSWIPFVGWIIAPFWAPFGIVASVRLAGDLRDAAVGSAAPRLAPLIAALSLVFLLGSGLSIWGGVRAYSQLRESVLSGKLLASGLDQEGGNALIAVLSGKASEAQTQRALSFVISQSSTVFTAP